MVVRATNNSNDIVPASSAPPIKKREIRGLLRGASFLTSGLVAINMVSFHSFPSLVYTSAGFLGVTAVFNLLVAFSGEGSFRSFGSSVADISAAFVCGIAYALQLGATETSSKALAAILHMFGFLCEVGFLAILWGSTYLGVACEVK